MFERFTEDAIQVIMLAQEETRKLGHNFVGSEQLLLGLLNNGGLPVGQILKESHIELEPTRRAVEDLIGRGTGATSPEIPFTDRAKRSLERSWDEARLLRSRKIGVEHLLLGILFFEDSTAVKALEAQNIDVQQVVARIHERVGASEPVKALSKTQDAETQEQLLQLLGAFNALSTVQSSLDEFQSLFNQALANLTECADATAAQPISDEASSSMDALETMLETLHASLDSFPSSVGGSLENIKTQVTRIRKLD